MEQLREIYRKYAGEIEEVHRKAPPLAGMFGMGGPKDHPCHLAFYNAVEGWVDNFVAAGPDAGQVAEAVRWILSAANEHRKESCYWFYFVAQTHCKKLILLMSEPDKAELGKWYDLTYPARDRLPVHEEVYALMIGDSGKKKKWKWGS